jgi:hypothetical protein
MSGPLRAPPPRTDAVAWMASITGGAELHAASADGHGPGFIPYTPPDPVTMPLAAEPAPALSGTELAPPGSAPAPAPGFHTFPNAGETTATSAPPGTVQPPGPDRNATPMLDPAQATEGMHKTAAGKSAPKAWTSTDPVEPEKKREPDAPKKGGCSCWKCLCYLVVPVLLAMGGTAALFKFGVVGPPAALKPFIPSFLVICPETQSRTHMRRWPRPSRNLRASRLNLCCVFKSRRFLLLVTGGRI